MIFLALVVVAVIITYLVLWIVVVTVTYKIVRRRGATRKTAWYAAGLACLIMFLIPFWDWVPTIAAHRYYCWKDSGFTVYKTLDRWKQENPGVAETLVRTEGAPTVKEGNTLKYLLNQRFIWEVRDRHLPLLPVAIREDRLVDRTTNAVLARAVDVTTGCGGLMTSEQWWCSWKSWLKQGPCDITGKAEREFSEMRLAAERLGERR
jgi:hypothetical protein